MIWFGLFLLLLPILVAPFETAGWHASRRGGFGHGRSSPIAKSTALQFVYFTGVAGYSGDFLARRERALLDAVRKSFPEAIVHTDIFPYSVSNLPLDGERAFRWLWTWLHKWRLKIPNSVFDLLIVVRNIGQLLVSADPRYGPVYNEGLAKQLEHRIDPTAQTVFLAYSGGAQMAVGAAGGLKDFLESPPHLIALGGVFTDDESIWSFKTVTQFRGTSDRWVPSLGKLIFPGLWRWQWWSAWNRYRRSGRFQQITPGSHCHVGKSDYFGFRKVDQDSDTTYLELTAQTIENTVVEILEDKTMG